MYNINLICIGRLKEDYLTQACAEYTKRLRSFCSLNIIELDEYRLPGRHAADIDTVVRREGEKIIGRIPPSSYTVGMFIDGESVTSEGLAAKLEKVAAERSGCINFIIGGSYGLSEEVRRRCDETLSVSSMTFPHRLFRVMLLEQIYRAFNIMSGGNYHK